MANVEVASSWEEFLYPDSKIPHDVHFLARRGDEGDEKFIGALKVLLADVSPVFREIFFGPLKETREVIEVNDTTHEAFHHDQVHLQVSRIRLLPCRASRWGGKAQPKCN